jgi:hypothetical protein
MEEERKKVRVHFPLVKSVVKPVPTQEFEKNPLV